MTARKRKGGPPQNREAAMRAWAAASPSRARAARDARRIDAREDDLEYGHRDPAVELHLDAMQDRYERALGWGIE